MNDNVMIRAEGEPTSENLTERSPDVSESTVTASVSEPPTVAEPPVLVCRNLCRSKDRRHFMLCGSALVVLCL